MNYILLIISSSINTLLGTYVTYSVAVDVPRRRTAVIMAIAVACGLLTHFVILFQELGLPRNMVYSLCVHFTILVTLVTVCKVKIRRALITLCFVFLLFSPLTFAASIFSFVAVKMGFTVSKDFVSRLCFIVVPLFLAVPYSIWAIPTLRSIVRDDRKEWVYLKSIILGFYLFGMVFFIRNRSTPEITAITLIFYVTLYMTMSVIAVSYRSQKKISKMEVAQREARLHAEAVRRQLELFTEMQNRFKAIRHDQRHMLSAILAYAHINETDKITRLVSQTIEELDETAIVPFCRNITINMILTNFERRSRQKNITLTIQTDIPENLRIKELDLTIIFFNALENSFEAVEKLPDSGTKQKEILLNCRIDRTTGQMALCIKNPVGDTVVFDRDGLPVSKNGDGHGYGTKRMSEAVERNNGVCRFSVENDIFTFRAVFMSVLVPENGQ